MGITDHAMSDQHGRVGADRLVYRGPVLGMLCAVAAVGIVLLAIVSGGGARRVSERRVADLVEVGGTLMELPVEGETEPERMILFRRWSWSALQRPGVVGAARLEASGRVLDVQPADLEEYVRSADWGSPVSEIRLGGGIGRVAVATASAGDGRSLVLFVRPAGWLGWADGGWWASVGVLLGACGCGCYWMCLSIRREIEEPLKRVILATTDDGRKDVLPVARRGAIGTLARNLERLFEDAEKSQARARQLHRTMDESVAARTRQVEAMLRRAERRAWIDPLTKLGNRRLLDDRLEEVFEVQRSCGEDLSLIAFDIDHFKNLNDTLGHGAGDEILEFVGSLFRGSLRSSDIGLRLGGDEFAAVLLGSGSREAAETAERFIRLFAQRASLTQVSPPVKMSAGVASIGETDARSGAELLKLADEALYAAKCGGRGRVHVHSRGSGTVAFAS